MTSFYISPPSWLISHTSPIILSSCISWNHNSPLHHPMIRIRMFNCQMHQDHMKRYLHSSRNTYNIKQQHNTILSHSPHSISRLSWNMTRPTSMRHLLYQKSLHGNYISKSMIAANQISSCAHWNQCITTSHNSYTLISYSSCIDSQSRNTPEWKSMISQSSTPNSHSILRNELAQSPNIFKCRFSSKLHQSTRNQLGHSLECNHHHKLCSIDLKICSVCNNLVYPHMPIPQVKYQSYQ